MSGAADVGSLKRSSSGRSEFHSMDRGSCARGVRGFHARSAHWSVALMALLARPTLSDDEAGGGVLLPLQTPSETRACHKDSQCGLRGSIHFANVFDYFEMKSAGEKFDNKFRMVEVE